MCIFSHLGVHFFHLMCASGSAARGVSSVLALSVANQSMTDTGLLSQKLWRRTHVGHQPSIRAKKHCHDLLFTGGLLSKVQKGGQGGIHVADVEICVTGANFISILPTAATCLHASLRCWQLKDCKEGKFGNVCLQLS